MKRYLFLFVLILFSLSIKAQISIELTDIGQWIQNNFVGQGVVLGHVKTHFASKEAAGIFSSKNVLQINDGLVLSTGDVRRIPGLNDKFNESTGFNHSGKAEQDKDLEEIEKGALFDIAYIEFDFVPFNNSISFNYQFGSDEYPEYVGSAYNDVFAFIVSDGNTSKNIALIPGKETPVSINTVNFKTDSSYYIDNNVFALKITKREDPSAQNTEEEVYRSKVGKILFAIKKFFTPKEEENQQLDLLEIVPNDDLLKHVNQNIYHNLQLDGITKKLVAQTYVTPYKKYHLKIIIADVSDNIYDSAVFLEKGSLTTVKNPQQPGFVDYPNLSSRIDPYKILDGENVKELIAQEIPKGKDNQIEKESENIIPVIYFDFDAVIPNQNETQKIYQLAKYYQTLEGKYQIKVVGYTDNKGSLSYNLELSKKRALDVANCLKSILPKETIINLENKAYLNPVASNETDIGRAKNRRVEVKFIKELE